MRELLFFKCLSDVYDEEYAVALEESDGDPGYPSSQRNHRFQVTEGCHWKDVLAKSANTTMSKSVAVMRTSCWASSMVKKRT